MKVIWDWGRVALMLLGSTLLPGRIVGPSDASPSPVAALARDGSDEPATLRALQPIDRPRALARGYRLPVVAVPDPPPFVATAAPAPQRDCPVDVRAIVLGDGDPATGFAVLATPDESVLVHAGEGVRTAHGWITVSSLSLDHVVLRHGDATFRCFLTSTATSSDATPGLAR